jgi:UDP-N-acetylmuramoyl-tripeptide--D-alanyl-D-alanine ligase
MISPALLAKYLKKKKTNDLLGDPHQPYSAISIDTRTLIPNSLFLALPGKNTHGTQHLNEAAKKGARMALIDQPISNPPLPCLRVDNLIKTLPLLAHQHRQSHSIPIIALTGSVGKTSSKNLLHHILQQAHPAHCTTHNQNNLLGVCLTLLRLGNQHESAVIECGTDAPGEIKILTEMINPTHSLILNTHPLHLNKLRSHKGIIEEKGALIRYASQNTTIHIPLDDEGSNTWQLQAKNRIVKTFGNTKRAHTHATHVQNHPDATRSFTCIRSEYNPINLHLSLPGAHHIHNTLAVISVASALNISPELIKKGVETAPRTKGRLSLCRGLNNATILDDTYNSSPKACKIAIDLLCEYNDNLRIMVMGDMNDLGSHSTEAHIKIGRYAKEKGIDYFIALGKQTQASCEAFGADAFWHSDHESLVNQLLPLLSKNTSVLIKGSRNQRMERVLDKLVEVSSC